MYVIRYFSGWIYFLKNFFSYYPYFFPVASSFLSEFLLRYCSNIENHHFCLTSHKMSREDIRKQILTLSEGEKHSVKEISSIIGVNRTTVWRVLKGHNSTGTVEHRKGAGRPAKLYQSVKYKCAKYVNTDLQKPVREISNDIEAKHGISVSKSTVHRTLQKMKYILEALS